MDIGLNAEKTPEQKRTAARRTAWILAAVAVTFFVLSIIEQIAITHQH